GRSVYFDEPAIPGGPLTGRGRLELDVVPEGPFSGPADHRRCLRSIDPANTDGVWLHDELVTTGQAIGISARDPVSDDDIRHEAGTGVWAGCLVGCRSRPGGRRRRTDGG